MRRFFTLMLIMFCIVTTCFKARAEENNFTYSSIYKTCSPWDSPAVTLVFSEKDNPLDTYSPYIEFSFFKNIEVFNSKKLSKPVVFKFNSKNSNEGTAVYSPKEDVGSKADTAEIVFEQIDKTGHVKGHYSMKINDKIINGSFETKVWNKYGQLCG